MNISIYFEASLDEQFDAWTVDFIPESQYGYVKLTGTSDYGAALSFVMHDCLNRRGEGILISFDVKGAFDKVWWARLKARLKALGMDRKALKLLRSYLFKRFIQVVHNGDKSDIHEIFSSVPQGARWSPKLWNMDISEMEWYLSYLAMLICYADDAGVWYEITDENRDTIVLTVNRDMENVLEWARDNKTTFEPSKTHFALISRKGSKKYSFAFPNPRLIFDGVAIQQKETVKLVGYTFDEELSWAQMISDKAKKARQRLGMLCRLRQVLFNEDMRAM